MSYPDSDGRTDEARTDDGSLGRRTYVQGLGLLASAVGTVGMGAGTASAATTRHGIEFDRVVNVVDDLGVDPNGNDPVQQKIENAEQEGTLFVFPEGEYLITERLLLLYNDTVGMLGHGNARFVVPERYNSEALIIDRGERVLFKNIDLDLRADGATPGLKFGAHDKAEIRDVELIGQGIHPNSDPNGEGGGNPDVTNALRLVARQPGTNVLVENFVAKNRGLMGAYNHGDSRVGLWIGHQTKGTVTLRNCHFSGFPNNGLYTSRVNGVVQVEGGVFRNNDISQVRLGSKGSYVEDALIEIDPSKSGSPNPEDMLNGRGVRIESGPIDTAGVTVRNCDIRIAENANSEGGIITASSGGKFDVIDTRIKVDAHRTHGIHAKRPFDSGGYAPPQPCRARLENVSITGSSDRAEAIRIHGRQNSVIDSCCIEQTGTNREGVTLVDSSGTVVKNSTLNVLGQQVNLQSTNANTWGNSGGGSCPLPTESGTSTAGSGSSGGDDDNSGGDDGVESSTDGSTKLLRIKGKNRRGVRYSIEVSGDIEGTPKTEGGDVASGSKARGGVGKWADEFEYTGTIQKLVVKGDATFVYDSTSNRMTFKGNRTGNVLSYTAEVGDRFQRRSSTSEEDRPESIDGGSRVEGRVGRWKDGYECTGDFRSVEMESVFSVDVSDA